MTPYCACSFSKNRAEFDCKSVPPVSNLLLHTQGMSFSKAAVATVSVLIPADTFPVDREIPASAGNCITFLCGIRIRLLHVDASSDPAYRVDKQFFLLSYKQYTK